MENQSKKLSGEDEQSSYGTAYLSTTTPPNSPDSVQPEHDVDPPPTPPSPTSPSPSAQRLSQKQRGRKMVLRNRSKVYAALYESNVKLGKAL